MKLISSIQVEEMRSLIYISHPSQSQLQHQQDMISHIFEARDMPSRLDACARGRDSQNMAKGPGADRNSS
jgi:hypothetical protein